MQCQECQNVNAPGSAVCQRCGSLLQPPSDSVDDPLAEIDGLLNGLNQQVDDQIQQQLDRAVTGVKQGMQGASVEQPAAPVEPAPPVFAADGAQVGIPSGSPPQGRSLLHEHEFASFIIPLAHQIEQSASFVFKSEFIQCNKQYKERIDAVTLDVDLADPKVGAYAIDDPTPRIIIKGGMARAMRLSAAGLSLHMQLREQGASPSHLQSLFWTLGELMNNGMFQQDDGKALYTECIGKEVDAAFKSGTERFVSLARSLGAMMEMYVIAHEAGHIALGHTLGPELSYDMSRNQEREADSFAASCLSTSPFRDQLFLGQVFATVILSLMDHASASTEVSTHPASRDRFFNALQSNKEAAEDAAEKYGLTSAELQRFLPPTGEA